MVSTDGGGWFYFGRVMHRRRRPFGHGFAYRVFSLYADVEALPALGRRLRLFSHNRWNIFSVYDRDLGPRDGRAWGPWIAQRLATRGIDLSGGRVRVLCFPRVLGYAFNPLAIWYCFAADGRLAAVLYDVSNTFGESHGYLLPVAGDAAPGRALEQACAKQFHVSPFMDMDVTYRFRVAVPAARLAVRIDQEDDAGAGFVATHTGRRAALTDRTLARAFFTVPLMTFKVIAGIHWQALRLWLKGARPRPRPTTGGASAGGDDLPTQPIG